MAQVHVLGLDVGSTTSKAVVLGANGVLVAKGIAQGGAGTPGPDAAVDRALKDAGLTRDQLVCTCATGYGRKLADWADFERSELSCHALGANRLFEDVHTVIDVGGQDAKVLRLDDVGNLENFVMNDKCAAGTGRFLDVMASVFGCDVADLSAYDEQAKEVASISSTCTVFAESEVISKLASGVPIADIVAGVHESVVDRTYGLVMRVGVKPNVAMTGGVALNDRLRRRLEKKLGYPVTSSPLSQYNGALGAAIYALRKLSSDKSGR